VIEAYKNKPIAITSIGLDGEAKDTISQKKKPRIKVYPKMFVATAKDTLLETKTTYKVMKELPIRTPLGQIVIIEIIKGGNVLVAGPSTNTEMNMVINELLQLSAYKVIVDGALFRKSIATHLLVDAIVFVTGAAYSKSMHKTLFDTKLIIDQFNTKPYELTGFQEGRTVTFDHNNNVIVTLQESLSIGETTLQNLITKDTKILYLPGALNDHIASEVIDNRDKMKGMMIVVKDATHILLTPEYYLALNTIGVEIRVLHPINLAFICYNPFSPAGYQYDETTFKNYLQTQLHQEVYNILKDKE
jgi:hypothetical protein